MKKHFAKRKRVIIDIVDGKIINTPTAIKEENVKEYVEKNGYKLIKILCIFVIFSIFANNVYAYDASFMTKLDLSVITNVYILIAIFLFSILLIFSAIKQNSFSALIFGCVILLFIGLILLINGFNVVLSIIVCIISLLIPWLGV